MTDVMTDAETCRLPNYADPATQLISKNYTTYVDEFVDAMTAGGGGPDILCTDSVQLQSVGFRVWYISTVNRSFTNEMQARSRGLARQTYIMISISMEIPIQANRGKCRYCFHFH
jgi:hypothetical protein